MQTRFGLLARKELHATLEDNSYQVCLGHGWYVRQVVQSFALGGGLYEQWSAEFWATLPR